MRIENKRWLGLMACMIIIGATLGFADLLTSQDIPKDLNCNQNIKGQDVCIQTLNVQFNLKYIDYFDDFKEVDNIKVGTKTEIIYSAGWTPQHYEVYKKLKVAELDLLNLENGDLLNPSLLDCQLNPKLPKCP